MRLFLLLILRGGSIIFKYLELMWWLIVIAIVGLFKSIPIHVLRSIVVYWPQLYRRCWIMPLPLGLIRLLLLLKGRPRLAKWTMSNKINFNWCLTNRFKDWTFLRPIVSGTLILANSEMTTTTTKVANSKITRLDILSWMYVIQCISLSRMSWVQWWRWLVYLFYVIFEAKW